MKYLPTTNDKRQVGIGSLSDTAPVFHLATFDEVFDREWSTDVHFACYSVIEPGESAPTEDPYPRIRKTALTSIREAGGEVVLGALALDFDLKDQEGIEQLAKVDDEGKPIWNTRLLDAFVSGVADLDEALAKRNIAAPLVYTTTHGARFVHRLTRPVKAEDGEDLLRGLHAVYAELGLVLDPLSDWTRLFRAPKVVRGDSRTWESRWYWIRWSAAGTDPDAIDPISKQQAYRDRYESIEPITSNRPTPEQVYNLLFARTGSAKGVSPTQMHKQAKTILRGTDCFPVLFEDRPLADEGARDSTLIKLVGQAVTRLLAQPKEPDWSPEEVYALFLAPVEQLTPDVGTPDWSESLWRKVCTCMERERAKLRANEIQREQQQELAQSRADRLLDKMRSTCKLPELFSEDPVTAQNALRQLLIIREPSGRFRAFSERGYTDITVMQTGLHFLIRNAAGIEDQIELTYQDENGDWKLVPEQHIARCATEVSRITGGAGVEHSHLLGTEWDGLTLQITLYRRNPALEPEYSQQVDEWLTMLTDRPEQLKRWLAYAIAFEDGPICALSLAGASGAGKGMLAQGLVETLETPARADKSVLVTRFNGSMARTPFLVVDEGLPRGQFDIADTFRSLTAGEPVTVENKYQTPITVRNPMRILFLANNLDVVQQLASHRLNDANDQAALAIRLMHLNVPDTAQKHLRTQGGMTYTKGWVEGADGSPSDFVLARHLLWMHAHRERFGDRDKRLLVEGRPDNSVVQSLRTSDRVSQAVAKAIIMAVESKAVPPSVRNGVSIENSRLRVTSRAIEEAHKQAHESNVQLTSVTIGRAMRNLLSPGIGEQERTTHKTLAGNSVQARWWDVDVLLLYEFAQNAGYPCDTINGLAENQYRIKTRTDV